MGASWLTPFAESARLTAMIFTLSGWLATAGVSFRFFGFELDEEIEERFQTAPARFGRPIRSRLARHILPLAQDLFSASGLGRLFLTWHSIRLLRENVP